MFGFPSSARAWLVLALITTWATSHASADPTPATRFVFPLELHIADKPDPDRPDRPTEPAADADFIERQLTLANRIFDAYGVAFRIQHRSAIAARHARMETRADRDALADYAHERGPIHVFLVATLRDVDEPERMRSGVHWHAPERDAHYVIVAATSGDGVLAHELGHFLGNAAHSDTPGNLMSYKRKGALPFLDEAQLRRMRRRIERYLREGELVTASEPAGAKAAARK